MTLMIKRLIGAGTAAVALAAGSARAAMIHRMLVCLAACVALECVAAESPVSAVSRQGRKFATEGIK